MKQSMRGATVLWLVAALGAAPGARAQMIGGAGPSTMSRGGNASGMRGSEPIDFTFFAGVMGGYETNVLAPIVNGEGNVDPVDLYGYGINIGAYGGHTWKRSTLGIDYRADYRNYPKSLYWNGTDQALGAEYRTILSRRWELVARQVAGTTSRAFGGFAAPSYIAMDYLSVPVTEIYNNRMYYMQSAAQAGYRASARTLYTVGGGLFRTYRQSRALVNANGVYTTAGWERRISRKMAIGAGHQYMRFTFPRAFGQSDLHAGMFNLTRNVGRYSNVQISAGVYRIETLGSEAYQLSPEVAAILGRPSGVRVFNRVNYLPTITATGTFRKRQTSYNVGYTRGAMPGNGVYLTSQNESYSAGASYTGFRRVSFGLSASHTRMDSLWQSAEPFRYSQVGGGLSYRLAGGFNWMTQIDWRDFSAGQTIASRRGVAAITGITYSTNALPLSLW